MSSVLRPHQHSIGYTGDGFYKMAPTEGRVARPERRCGCRHGTPKIKWKNMTILTDNIVQDDSHKLSLDLNWLSRGTCCRTNLVCFLSDDKMPNCNDHNRDTSKQKWTKIAQKYDTLKTTNIVIFCHSN